jgi:high-affinity nickel permease
MAIVIQLAVYLVIGFLFGLGFHLAGKILKVK